MAPTGMGSKREEEELETAKYRKLFFEEFYSKEKQRNGMVARGECGRKVCYCFKVHLLIRRPTENRCGNDRVFKLRMTNMLKRLREN